MRFASTLRLCALLAGAGAPLGSRAAPPAVATAPGAPKEIRLKTSQGLLSMPAEINGVKGALFVDTGAVDTHLRRAMADTLRAVLKPDTRKAAGIGGVMEDVMKGAVTVVVPGCTQGDFPGLSGPRRFLPLSLETEVPGFGAPLGVIGLQELRKAGAVIDCAGARMRLHPGGDFRPRREWREIQLVKFEPAGSPDGAEFLWAAAVLIGEHRAMMILDTAAQATLLTEPFAQTAGIRLREAPILAAGAGNAMSTMKFGVLPGLILDGRVNLGRLEVVAGRMDMMKATCANAQGEDLPVAGILGIDQLVRMKAILDCGQGRLYAPREPLPPAKGIIPAETKEEDPPPAEVKGDSGGEDAAPPDDGDQVLQALQTLARAGDTEAKDLLDQAVDNGGRIELTPEAAAGLVARAREKGLPAGKSEGVIPATPDAPDPGHPRPAVPPLVPPVTDEALIMKAVDALVLHRRQGRLGRAGRRQGERRSAVRHAGTGRKAGGPRPGKRPAPEGAEPRGPPPG
ncbi:MAG: aspartyl protease family protein [Kiritimatiellia bacterium]